MEVRYSKKAERDLEFWSKSGNKSILKKIAELIKSIQQNPYEGIGKPEALKHELSGYWSRRIDFEHRIIYQIIDENTIEILNIISLKGHYF
ncbi:toxin of toxin-antitoxin system [Flavobacterium branchiophilum NBRC 15030 = ATCC 35035]|uniref:Putative mRNA interferase YoeB n=1 Tax=Flavobacterium branchiophilum TaxID=55197 RepID=A0A543G544_9FLAO|nr:Txe/YoeB family addiction module toxin [Flavobacterium branchiophilum]OXA78363.1 toxin of toxin-antitoxin system [Flavobacterium branchiophilum NBRC 15030 = ATCC 35035]TQM41165.1 toxin YoeB [Flavobacterium branchiophilum]GEM56260.1 Txe/YoeB family addiction module toxin [Flavobacterium branchiophilum NBRC 15030 = ATCC 35035]